LPATTGKSGNLGTGETREMNTTKEKRVRDGHQVARVHDELRSMILRGELRPGSSLSQSELVERLDIGRTPLREALRLLQSEGLLEAAPNRNVKIADFTLDDVEDLYVMRVALECSAALFTVRSLGSGDIAELGGLMAQMEHFEEERDHLGWEQPHRALHMKLVSAAGPGMQQTIDRLWDHAERYRRFFELADPPYWLLRAEEHRHLVETAKERDSVGVSRLLALHYSWTVSETMKEAGSDKSPDALDSVVRRFAGAEGVK